MGAFDCELAALGYRTKPNSRKEYQPPAPDGFYVSWDGSNGGATGQWFDTKDEAEAAVRQKFSEGKHPVPWFEMESRPKREDCFCDRCQYLRKRRMN